MAHPQIAAFARLAKENTMPTRLLAGQATRLSRTMHDIRYDAVHDEFLVTNPFAQAIMVFRGGADGEEAPIRIIQGAKTLLAGVEGNVSSGVDRLDVDPVHDEIFIPSGDKILVYPRTGNGNISPLRVIQGPDTKLTRAQSIAVDPVNNVIVAGTNKRNNSSGSLLIFNRTGRGNAKPIGLIMGPRTGIGNLQQLRVYPPKGWIVAPQTGDSYGVLEPEGVFIGVWSIHDDGDIPPRWKLGGPGSIMKKPRGIALNPKDKELIIADMRLNSVLTYYFPEIF